MVNTPLPVNALNLGEQGSFVTIARLEGSEMKVYSSFPRLRGKVGMGALPAAAAPTPALPRKRGRESVACATREIWQELGLN